MMIQFYELYESEVLNSKLEPGALICCKDSANIYMVPTDPAAGTAPVKMGDTVKFLTEEQRLDMLAPINGKLYFTYNTGRLWIYFNDWKCLNRDAGLEGAQFSYEHITVTPGSSITINATNAKNTSSAEFVPDLSVIDLINLDNVQLICSEGLVTVKGASTMSYPITGRVLLTV